MSKFDVGDEVVALETACNGFTSGEDEYRIEVGSHYVVTNVTNSAGVIKIRSTDGSSGAEGCWWAEEHFKKFTKNTAKIEVSDVDYGEIFAKRASDDNVYIELNGVCGDSFLYISEKEFEKLVDKLNKML